LRLDKCRQALTGLSFEIATAVTRVIPEPLQGYPVPTSKKKRACVVTYRHSGEQLFENSFSPYCNLNAL
jgi:hypothetical protein